MTNPLLKKQVDFIRRVSAYRAAPVKLEWYLAYKVPVLQMVRKVPSIVNFRDAEEEIYLKS